jgi:hypothetical protein
MCLTLVYWEALYDNAILVKMSLERLNVDWQGTGDEPSSGSLLHQHLCDTHIVQSETPTVTEERTE